MISTPRLSPLLHRLLAAVMIVLLLPLPQLAAQASAAAQSPAPTMLHITILDGDEALNNIRERTAREPIIQVEDQNHKPVAGALVVFAINRGANGAGAAFTTPYSASTTLHVTTNAQGQAVAHGITPNSTAGSFTISVQASVGALTTTTVITVANSVFAASSTGGSASSNAANNSNSNSSSSSSSTGSSAGSAGSGAGAGGGILHVFHIMPKWAVVGVVAGAATTAAVVVTTLNNNNGANISIGTGSVTHP